MLDLEFMRLALCAGVVVGLLAPAVGFFLVQRKLSLIGDGVGHLAFAGVAAGYLLGVSPTLAALVAAVSGAVGIEELRSRRTTAGDQALALFFYGGIAGGVVMISAADRLDAGLFSILFGSILTVSRGDVIEIAALGLVALAAIVVLYRGLVAVAVDEEAARASGVPVRAINLCLAVLAGLTVAISMRVVGILLVAALMALPVMTASRLARSLRAALVLSLLIGVLTAIGGLVLAYYADLAAGGAIVLLAASVFVATLAAQGVSGRLRA